MEKDFDKWNNYKKLLEQRDYLLKFHEGEIWNCYIGENVGCEECGKNDFLRPVVILRKISRKGFIGVPTSSKKQQIDMWFQEISYQEGSKEVIAYVLLTQIRFFDSRRLAYVKANISKEQLKKIRRKVGILIKVLEKLTPPSRMAGEIGVISTMLFVSLVLLLLYQII